MIYKMGMSAEQSWRRLRGFRQLGKVIEGVKFKRRRPKGTFHFYFALTQPERPQAQLAKCC